MSNVRVAKEFFAHHLPQKIKAEIDFDSLHFHKETFIDDDLKFSAADVIYSAQIGHNKGYLYLLVEHQSTVDKWIAFRLWRYLMRLLEHYHHQYPDQALPLVYPLIFYNGQTPYHASTDFFELFAHQAELAREIWGGSFQLVDIQKIPDQEMREYLWAGVVGFVLKHRFVRDFLDYSEELMGWLYKLELAKGAFSNSKMSLKG